MDAIRYFYERYGEIKHHVSMEEYAEYLEYKREMDKSIFWWILFLGSIFFILLCVSLF